jgi:hypothetical protein
MEGNIYTERKTNTDFTRSGRQSIIRYVKVEKQLDQRIRGFRRIVVNKIAPDMNIIREKKLRGTP